MTRKLINLLALALAAALILSLAPLHAAYLAQAQPRSMTGMSLQTIMDAADAQCETDSECAALCPQSDEDCDGGPQPSTLNSPILGVRA